MQRDIRHLWWFSHLSTADMKIPFLRYPLRTTCLCLGVFVAVPQVFGVTIGGDILVTDFKADGTVAGGLIIPFHISTADNQWKLRVDCRDDYYELAGFDGEKTCAMTVYSMSKLMEDLGPTNATKASPPAIINGTSYPFSSEPAARVAWLAFASASFFSSNSQPFLPALWSGVFTQPVSHALRLTNIEYIPDSLGLPSNVSFILSTEALLANATNDPFLSKSLPDDAITKTINQLKGYNNFQIARYKVTSTTNFEDHTFPLAFELAVFNPVRNFTQQTYRGTLREITSFKPESFLPKLDRPVYAQDYRFSDSLRGIDRISYSLTNSVWPNVSDPVLQKIFKQKQASIIPLRASSRWRVRFAFLAFILLTFPVVFHLLRRKDDGRNSNHTNLREVKGSL